MKPEELRIGNWILYCGSKNKVTGIMCSYDEHEYIVEVNPPDCFNAHWSQISPIPLTEEWLERFGFEKVESWAGTTFENTNGDWANPGGQMYIISEDVRTYCPKYVHQLQNLYYALTGEELILKNS
jgi:hypothetical protein